MEAFVAATVVRSSLAFAAIWLRRFFSCSFSEAVLRVVVKELTVAMRRAPTMVKPTKVYMWLERMDGKVSPAYVFHFDVACYSLEVDYGAVRVA